ncbi:hypothetical protein DMN77_18055 [Paenibacillus sp. 79R4]|nr:hypothetical protein [Paenibacillus sp. 79R4]
MLPLSMRVSSPPGASRQLGLLIWLDIDSATMVNRALQRDVAWVGSPHAVEDRYRRFNACQIALFIYHYLETVKIFSKLRNLL